jgi:hypothetical protein
MWSRVSVLAASTAQQSRDEAYCGVEKGGEGTERMTRRGRARAARATREINVEQKKTKNSAEKKSSLSNKTGGQHTERRTQARTKRKRVRERERERERGRAQKEHGRIQQTD